MVETVVRRPTKRARRASAKKSRANRGGRRPRAVRIAVAMAVVVAALAGALWWFGRDDGPVLRPLATGARAGSVLLPRGTAVPELDTPLSYRMRLRVDDYAGGERVTNREELTIRRPFDSERVVLGREDETRTVTVLGRWSVPRTGRGMATLEIGPSAAASDFRLDPKLVAALPDGVLEPREARRVADRVCQVYRAAGPLAGGVLRRLDAAEPGEYADLCVDGAGLLLEQLWVVDGRVMERRLAQQVVVEPELGSDAFALSGDALPAKEGGGSIRAVDPVSQPSGEFWTGTVPPGFTHAGRYAVVHPVADGEKIEQSRRLTSVADVFVRGPDLVVLEQGGTVNQMQRFPAPGDAASTATIDGLGTAELIASARANEARVLLSRGRFVRAYGTVPLAELEGLLHGLRLSDAPGGLRYID